MGYPLGNGSGVRMHVEHRRRRKSVDEIEAAKERAREVRAKRGAEQIAKGMVGEDGVTELPYTGPRRGKPR